MLAERPSRKRATRETKQDENIIQTSAAFASACLNDSHFFPPASFPLSSSSSSSFSSPSSIARASRASARARADPSSSSSRARAGASSSLSLTSNSVSDGASYLSRIEP